MHIIIGFVLCRALVSTHFSSVISLSQCGRIDTNFVIIVADFGLVQSIGVKEYFRQDEDSSVRLPLKWLALESITDYIFSEKIDVVGCNLNNIMY